MVDDRAVAGAKNNADLYAAVFSVHGLGYRRNAYAFVAEDAPPPFYSHLTVQSADDTSAVMLEVTNTARRFDGALGLKDSFCQLDGLAEAGFSQLFEASWIWREPVRSDMPAGWKTIENAQDLLLWETAWKAGGSPTDRRMFPAEFLSRIDVVFLGRIAKGRLVAGCIANRSDDCVGLSNVFAEEPSATTFAEAADAVDAISGGVPIVGYESGAELDYAVQAGFTMTGSLQVLVARNATL